MSAYEPPSQTYPVFDSLVFQSQNDASITKAEADLRYLARTGTATSVASTTDFGSSSITTTGDINGLFRTVNTTANATHFLNFSDSSATGNGNIQKNAGLSYNPSTQVLTVNNGLSIPTGPLLGRNDTVANSFFGTNPYSTHPIGWTISVTKAVAIPTSNVTVDVIAFGTPTTAFNTLSNGLWNIKVCCNNAAVLGAMTYAVLSFGSVTGGTIVNGTSGTSATSLFHQTTAGLSNMGMSYPDLIIRTTGNGTTGLIINFMATYSTQPTINFIITATKIG